MSQYDDYIGILEGAPPPFLFAISRLPVLDVLTKSESAWARGCYVPQRKPDFDADIGVLFQPFQWDEQAPWTWLFTTIGLSALEQDSMGTPGRRTFRRIELTATFLEPSGWEEFRRAWQFGTLDSYQAFPSVLGALAIIAQDIASWMVRDQETFGLGDPVQNAQLLGLFPSVLLVPPVPELLVNGLTPFSAAESGGAVVADIPPADWCDKDLLAKSGDGGFLQLAPLMEEEFDVAIKNQGWNFFLAGLLPTDEELDAGMDSSTHISNLYRPSRLSTFRAAAGST